MFSIEYGLNKPIDPDKKQIQRFFLLSLKGEEVERVPKLNVAFVLDKSGSMDGEPIRSLKTGIRRALEVLKEGDRVSIIVFDSIIETLVHNTEITEKSKGKIRRLIETIDAMGGTCIDEGLEAGLEELQKVDLSSYVNWIILLTDGKNEHGSDEHAIEVATKAKELGIPIFTIGLGKHWSPTLLEKLSDITKGEMFYVENPRQLKEIFAEKANRIRKTVAKNVEVYIKLHEGVEFSEINPAFIVRPQIVLLEPVLDVDTYIIPIGDVFKNEHKDLLFQIFIRGDQKYLFDLKFTFYDIDGNFKELPWMQGIPAVPYKEPTHVRNLIDRLSVYLQSELVSDLLEGGSPEQALTLLQTMQLTATRLNDEELQTIIEQNVTKLKEGVELSDEDLIKTKVFTKTVMKDE